MRGTLAIALRVYSVCGEASNSANACCSTNRPSCRMAGPVAELAEGRQRGRQIDRRHPVTHAQIVEQRHDLCCDGDVERLRDVIGDEHRRLGADRIDDHRTLHHAAGKFRWIIPVALLGRRNAYLAQELHDPFTAFALTPFRPDAVELLGDLASHRHRRIERALRLRADIGDVAADADFADSGLENVMAGEGDLACTIFEAFRQPVRQRPAENRLACAAFAVNPENSDVLRRKLM